MTLYAIAPDGSNLVVVRSVMFMTNEIFYCVSVLCTLATSVPGLLSNIVVYVLSLNTNFSKVSKCVNISFMQ